MVLYTRDDAKQILRNDGLYLAKLPQFNTDRQLVCVALKHDPYSIVYTGAHIKNTYVGRYVSNLSYSNSKSMRSHRFDRYCCNMFSQWSPSRMEEIEYQFYRDIGVIALEEMMIYMTPVDDLSDIIVSFGH